MRHVTIGLGILLVAGAAIRQAGAASWVIVGAIAVLALAAWQLGRCRHPGPLGLLPPTHEPDGSVVPARWFCDGCGRTWPAVFEREQRPVARFVGYDQTKATAAARRAEDLARRQRALALRRAGIVTAATNGRRSVARGAEVVPILRKRRFGQ